MKQVLLRANNTYLFELPKTYELFINTISDKLKSDSTYFTVYQKSKKIHKNNFTSLNEDLNILDISMRLQGGGDFPSVSKLLFSVIGLNFLVIVIKLILLYFILHFVNYTANPIDFSNLQVQTLKNSSMNDILFKEILMIGIIIFVFSITHVLSIVYLKSTQCPTFKPSFNMYKFLFIISISLIVSIIIYNKKYPPDDNNIIYLLIGIVFIGCGLFITYRLNNELKKFENNENNDTDENDLYKIVIWGAIGYSIIRIISLIQNKDNKIIILFAFISAVISATPSFIDSYMKYTSGLSTSCPQ